MQLPDHIASELGRRRAQRGGPASDGNPDSVSVYTTLGLTACMTADGDVFLETYELDGATARQYDRSAKGQLMALALGSINMPELKNLLPDRPPDARSCTCCGGSGWKSIGALKLICEDCCTLGWVVAA